MHQQSVYPHILFLIISLFFTNHSVAKSTGLQAFQQGHYQQAAARWQQQLENNDNLAVTARWRYHVRIASAYRYLGDYKKAEQWLNTSADTQPELSAEAQLQWYLERSKLYLAQGQKNYKIAKQSLAKGLGLLVNPGVGLELKLDVYNQQGNLELFAGDYDKALALYQKAAIAAKGQVLEAKIHTNLAYVYFLLEEETKDEPQNEQIPFKNTQASILSAKSLWKKAPPSFDKTLALLKLANICTRQKHQSCAFDLGQQALATAKTLTIPRALAYSYGYLGHVYFQKQQYQNAEQLSQQALFYAQQSQDPEQIYLWAWQLGKAQKQQKKSELAIEAYRLATRYLKPIQSQISSSGFQLKLDNFRQQIAPVYFELADLLLAHSDQKQARLLEAMETIELFKQAELQDYLQQSCTSPQRQIALGDILDNHTAVLYPVSLKDRTALLLGFKDQLLHIPVAVPATLLRQQTTRLQAALSIHPENNSLNSERGFSRGFSRKERSKRGKDKGDNTCIPVGKKRSSDSRLSVTALNNALTKIQTPAKQLYQWLITPLKHALESRDIDTLIIVPDGILRTIPFASLYDGEHYLIEQYALVTSPGLQLSDKNPHQAVNANILLGGISDAVQGFSPIPCVGYELEQIHQLFGQKDNLLLNENFTLPRFSQQLKQENYDILHLASHGQFNNRLEETFLLTHDNKISMGELSRLVRLMSVQDKAVELLTLSACETALGDDKAALGLAGIALKSGARSTLASLWQVDDEATPAVIIEFYRQLKSGNYNKAKALQQAQLKLLHNATLPQYRNPYFWSAFLLIGHWL